MKNQFSENNSWEGKTKLKVSYEEFLEWCDEDTLAEWEDGEIIMTSPASKKHQDISTFLLKLLDDYVEFHKLGEIMSAPFQMKTETSGREPDILYVSNDHLDRFKETYLDGPADMVMEIVSEESGDRDRGKKFLEYEAAGIPEYWLIDPIRQQVEFYRIGKDNHYHFVLPDADGIFHSEAIPEFWLKVSWLWQDPMPPAWKIRRELGIP